MPFVIHTFEIIQYIISVVGNPLDGFPGNAPVISTQVLIKFSWAAFKKPHSKIWLGFTISPDTVKPPLNFEISCNRNNMFHNFINGHRLILDFPCSCQTNTWLAQAPQAVQRLRSITSSPSIILLAPLGHTQDTPTT